MTIMLACGGTACADASVALHSVCFFFVWFSPAVTYAFSLSLALSVRLHAIYIPPACVSVCVCEYSNPPNRHFICTRQARFHTRSRSHRRPIYIIFISNECGRGPLHYSNARTHWVLTHALCIVSKHTHSHTRREHANTMLLTQSIGWEYL